MEAQGGEIDTGALFREAHRGCWRADAPPLELEPREVLALMPLLIRTGSVGLVWPRLRHRAAELGATGAGLEAAYQSQVEHNARVEREIARVVGHLQGHGIDPVLIKGWAVSRLYPEGLVRPAGDIDLVVPDEDYERAKGLLAGTRLSLHRDSRRRSASNAEFERDWSIVVDLHSESRWGTHPGEGALERAVSFDVCGAKVRTLGPEDTLRMLCFHFLGHGATRILRLVDIAMLLEDRSTEFDWDRLLGSDVVGRNWVVTAIGLAHRLLDARISDTPVSDAARGLPKWLVPIAEAQVLGMQAKGGNVLAELRANPADIGEIVARRWPDPVLAVAQHGVTYSDRSPWRSQTLLFGRRLATFVARKLPGQAVQAARRR